MSIIPRPASLEFKLLCDLHQAMLETHATETLFQDFKVLFSSTSIHIDVGNISFSIVQFYASKLNPTNSRNSTTLKVGPSSFTKSIVQLLLLYVIVIIFQFLYPQPPAKIAQIQTEVSMFIPWP